MARVVRLGGPLVLLVAGFAGSASAATPSVEQALGLAPVQKDVEYARPDKSEAAKCTVKSEKIDGKTGWVVRSSGGDILRRFLDTNGDNVVDQWSYYADGIEVYRDIDSDFNGKADQYRWMNTGGTKWGIDKDEDGKVDNWKVISAEEVSAEAVRALAERDPNRFGALLLTTAELNTLGVGADAKKDLSEKVSGAAAAFKEINGKQKTVNAKTTWVHFGGTRPGMVPAGTDGSTQDVIVYENIMAMVETGGQTGQVQIGTLVRVGDAWRMVTPPAPVDPQGDLADNSVFFRTAESRRPQATPENTGIDPKTQAFYADLEKLEQQAAEAKPEELGRIHAARADLMLKIAATVTVPEDRDQWIRQLADTLLSAVQGGSFPDGVARLDKLRATVKDKPDLLAYVEFRFLMASYGLKLQDPKVDFQKVQDEWIEALKKFVATYPKSGDAADAMLQMASTDEFAGKEDEAKKWYGDIVAKFPDSTFARKARGAIVRLDSVGNIITLKGNSVNGGPIDLAQYRGKAVLIQYWATWCEPCKADMANIRELQTKYGKDLAVIGVSLDAKQADLTTFLKQNRMSWPQLYEPGGLDSRFAAELGILTLPTMILVDKSGKVANRSIHVTELDREIGALVK